MVILIVITPQIMKPAVSGVGVVDIGWGNSRRIKAAMVYEIKNLLVENFSLTGRNWIGLVRIFHGITPLTDTAQVIVCKLPGIGFTGKFNIHPSVFKQFKLADFAAG